MSLLFKYYTVFFHLHHKDVEKGMTWKDPWFSAFAQLIVSVGGFLVGVSLILENYTIHFYKGWLKSFGLR